MNTNDLRKFLIYCGKEGYASIQDEDEGKEDDHSTSITLTRGAWRFHDNYFGGEPYGGREVVFFENNPVWIMTYYGRALERGEINLLYGFLKKALALIPNEAPYRGPREFSEDDWRYENTWQGALDNFSGEEIIYHQGKKVYFAKYIGGLINLS
jgi:hypothetical protein